MFRAASRATTPASCNFSPMTHSPMTHSPMSSPMPFSFSQVQGHVTPSTARTPSLRETILEKSLYVDEYGQSMNWRNSPRSNFMEKNRPKRPTSLSLNHNAIQ